MGRRAKLRAFGTKVAVGVTAGALASGLAGALAASPAAAAKLISVNCKTDNLQTAINNAAPDSVLSVKGTCTGNFTIAKDLTLRGIGATLDGGGSGTVLTVNSGVSADLAFFTIKAGHSSSGGGILNNGTLVLAFTPVSNNTADLGGGIYNNRGAMRVIAASQVSNNMADIGGGIFNNHGTIFLDSRVSKNTASVDGGGIYNNQGSITPFQDERPLVSDNSPNNCAPLDSVPFCTG
jgi:nitrous oxidase accessory protein NosD